MLTNNSDRSWRRFGRLDPYFGVISHPQFKDAASPGAARDEFFRSGEEHVERVLAVVRESLCPDFKPKRVLDFGCGVGRVLVPLARLAQNAEGIDVSREMLREAERNCLQAGLSNVTLRLSDDDLTALEGRTFDFIHSYIVLQHIAARRGLRLIETLVNHLEPGGISVLHVTYGYSGASLFRVGYKVCATVPGAHALANVLRGRPPLRPLMQMNLYPLNSIFAALQSLGCQRIAVRFSDHSGYLGVLLFLQRARSCPELGRN